MNLFALLANVLAKSAETATDPAELAIQYAIYGVIIVAGLIVLTLLRRADKPLKHTELKKQLVAFQEELTAFSQAANTYKSYQCFKAISKLLYRLNKLIMQAAVMAEKERDGDISAISVHLENARNALATYKFGCQEAECKGIRTALEKVSASVTILEKILVRDAQLQKRQTKKS